MTLATQAPPGILTGPKPPYANGIGIPGFCHLKMIPGASEHLSIWTDAEGQHHGGDVVIGETEAHGPIRLYCDSPAQLRALALALSRYADWIEALA